MDILQNCLKLKGLTTEMCVGQLVISYVMISGDAGQSILKDRIDSNRIKKYNIFATVLTDKDETCIQI